MKAKLAPRAAAVSKTFYKVSRFVAHCATCQLKIVVCRAGKSSTWEGSSEQIYTFETKKGPFTCKSKDITSEAQHALDTLGTVKAEVDPEPDDFGYIRLKRFIVDG